MINRLKFIFGTIVGVMIGLIMGWLLSGLLTASLFLFLFSDLPEPWTNVQEKTAIIVGIIGWVLITLGGFIGGKLGWRRSRGEPTRLLNELKLKNLLPVIIALTAVGLTVAGINIVVRLRTPPPVTPLTSTPRQVAIITNKTVYEQGEIVEITARNGSDRPVWYLGGLCDPRCCGIERLKDDNWEPVEKIFCILPERGFVISPQKLEAGKEFSQEWEPMRRAKYDTHTFIEPGEYRISFSYGPKESSCEENIIYSNGFTIKEKEYPTYGKIIDINLMVHRDDTVTEAEPIEIKMGRPTSPSILKQLEGDYLLRVGERVDRLWIGTVLWSQSFPVDFDYTGPVIEGIDYSEIRYDRVFVSFRIPYEPRMRSLQLWHKDKLIFFKELPKFYPINGVITDYKGKPVERVFVQLGGEMSGSTFTDPDGNYSFSELKEGSYSIIVSPSGKLNLMSESKEVELSSEETITINFTLQPCGSIAGKITDVQGNPLIEAWAQIVGFETPRYHVQKDGSYIIPYLQMGEYGVKVDVKIGEKYIEIPPKKAKVELGQTTTVNFVLEK